MSEGPAEDAAALDLVHQGWNHLRLQRPQAAWASWHRCLRLAPGFRAAEQALATFESAGELPAAARAVYRFQAPRDAVARARWDERLPRSGSEDLAAAAAAFAALAAGNPCDSGAAFNEGLCLAWLGRNRESIAALDRAVRLLAAADFDRAVEAWTLAEVLRQGAGAEDVADDLSYAWIIDRTGSDVDVAALLARAATLVAVPTPRDPVTGELHCDAQVFEWLDHAMPATDEMVPGVAQVPRLLATVVQSRSAVRLSSPDPRSLAGLLEPLRRILGAAAGPIQREAAPLPLPLLDAAVWSFRLPRGLDAQTQAALTRGAVETYFEDRWIHVARKGLDGLSPLEAAARAERDVTLRARLSAVVRLREQLGARPRTAALYQGYPFDRLRRRLGLAPIDPLAVDAEDATCASGAELDRLDPQALDDACLAEAFESAAGLEDDARTARFAAALARRPAPRLARSGLTALFAPLVRQAMAAARTSEALDWIDRALELDPDRGRRTFETWRAEIQARTDNPDAALETYQGLLGPDPADAALALDGAETLIDNGHPHHARVLLEQARAAASRAGDGPTAEHATNLLDAL
jgi:tetratricopeptide (TPR) repeat protein